MFQREAASLMKFVAGKAWSRPRRRHPLGTVALTSGLALFIGLASGHGLSTDRIGHVFSSDEPIVLKTSVRGPARWRLSNDYGERIEGTTPVVDGRVAIPAEGLRYGRYTFEVEGDGSLVGGVVPPLIELPPDLCSTAFAPFQLHWRTPQEALLWRQIGFWEIRYEFGLTDFNPTKGVYRPDPDMDRYLRALAEQGIRPSFKINGPPRWNDSSTVPRKQSEPRSYPDYEESLQAFARHFRLFGLDRYYIVNEPEAGGWWAGGWEGYYRFLSASHRALKAVDPGILVIAPESWDYVPEFLRRVLQSRALDVVSGHYPVDEQGGNVHGAFYFTEMRRTGIWLPFINGEDFYVWTANLDIPEWRKLYPGIVGGITGGALVPTLLVSRDVGAHRTVGLHLQPDSKPEPFARYAEGDIVVSEQLFQNRAANDALAGARLIGRLTDAPPNVLGWVYQRGRDRFLVAYVAPGRQSQLLEITTRAERLRVVDTFGNASTARPVEGRLRVLLTNVELYVHGLQEEDRFNFLHSAENLPPQIMPPGPVVGAVGRPFLLAMDGFDGETDLPERRLPRWQLVAAPEGMRIRPGSGVIEWTPARAGPTRVTVRLTDADGAAAECTFTIEVRVADANLPPRITSRPTPVAVLGGTYRYAPQTVDPDGDPVHWSVCAPEGAMFKDGVLTWRPRQPGAFEVAVGVEDGRGGRALQQFDLVVCPNPDRPDEAEWPPRMATDLTVVRSDASGVTLVWNRHSPGAVVVQRAPAAAGPWGDIAVTETTWHTDRPPPGPVWYRVKARNRSGDSEPTRAVNGRNRAPLADAGPSLRLEADAANRELVLDGSASYDPEGQPLRFQWTLVNAPRGAHVYLAETNAARARFTTDQSGRFLLSLVVHDGEQSGRPDDVWVILGGNLLERTVYAGPPRCMEVGQSLRLSATASPATKEEGWFWRLHTLPFDGYVRLAKNAREPLFRPEIPGVYQVMVFATDDWMYGFPDLATIIVTPSATAERTVSRPE